MDLSILIPARNEMFLARTVESVLENVQGDTEVIVVCDGNWPDPPVADDSRLTLVYHPVSVGQRAATNEAARIAQGRYVMKLDAHCAVGPGFDVIMMENMEPDWTMVPTMYNLHAFDWVCQECGYCKYQGRTPAGCPECAGSMKREMVWKAKHNPKTTAMRFDRDLKFAYWRGYKKRQRGKGDLVDTMSILGACWMLERDRYFELDICDEAHGSWGQQGTEVACKTWLSGGRLVVNKRTWFAHMFRTQGGDFGFPYSIKGSDVRRARDYSQRIWKADRPDELPDWDRAIHPLSWLIDKFAPVPDWEDTERMPSVQVSEAPLEAPSDVLGEPVKEPTKGIVYYTDNRLDSLVMAACQRQLEGSGLPVVSASLKPIDLGQNVVVDGERGALTMFRQILAGLEASDADLIFFAEHDVLYHSSHWEFQPSRSDHFYYNQNSWRVDLASGKALFHYSSSTSGLCANRKLLLEHYRKRVAMVETDGFTRRMGFEPGTHGRKERVDDYKSEVWMSEWPNLDIRHRHCFTQSRWKKEQFRNQRFTKGWAIADEVPGWGQTRGRMKELLHGLSN